jgi:ABC-2 type transport system permease protein
MVALLRADLFKFRKRAMGWVMLAIIAVFVPLEMLPNAFLFPGTVNYSFPGGLLEGLTPLPFVGTFIMIVLGGMLIGMEYGYDTWKNLLIRRPGRVPFILSKWLVLFVATGIGLIVLLPLGQIVGLILGSILHLTGSAVSLSVGSALLLILLQALLPLIAGSVSLMAAVIGRSSVAGIVIGIVWFLIDSLIGGLFPLASLSNATVLLQAKFTGLAIASNGGIGPVHIPSALQGPLGLVPIAVIIFYLIIPITVAAAVFRKRDMLGVA